MLDIACIILTKNEVVHIERCIRSAKAVCREIWVVDSFSDDATCQLADQLGAHVVQHPFTNQAEQFNWAIETLPIESAWVWRLDADEIISQQLAELALREFPHLAPDVNGVVVNKQIVFMGHALRYGGWYPAPQIKLIRRGFGRCEDKVMDEHLMILSGKTVYWNGDQTDWNLRDLDWWWQKHQDYARREAESLWRMRVAQKEPMAESMQIKGKLTGSDTERKRWMKNVYSYCPLFVRPILYFLCRYLLLGGFLDGYAGWYWHTRQGLRYRMLVDYEYAKLLRK